MVRMARHPGQATRAGRDQFENWRAGSLPGLEPVIISRVGVIWPAELTAGWLLLHRVSPRSHLINRSAILSATQPAERARLGVPISDPLCFCGAPSWQV